MLTNEVFTNWIETVVLPILPSASPNRLPLAGSRRSLTSGTGDMTIEVVATTDKGEKLRQQVLVKASEYGTVTFVTNSPLVSIETDPENKFLQIDYANDIYPDVRQSPNILDRQILPSVAEIWSRPRSRRERG
jgi:hypothetical protein